MSETILPNQPVPVTESGTWTVQPGNTANTTAWKVDGSAVTQPISGTITANAGTNLNTSALALESGGNLATVASAVKAEDAASADADKGIPSLAVRKATPANTSGTDGDYENFQISAGRLWTSATVDSALPTGTNSIGKISDITASIVPGTGATNLGKAEDAAHTSSDTGVMMLGVRQSTPTDLSAGATNGDYEPYQVDANGAVWVSLATLIAGEDLTNNVMRVEQRFSYNNIATATTTTVKSGSGFLHAISVNTKGTVASTITVYDNTAGSGTKIGTIDSLNLSGIFIMDVSFNTGLTFVTTGTIAPDITVSYR